jgi:hypothetical protein
MKRTLIVILLLLAVLFLSSCQGASGMKETLMGLKDRISGEESIAYHKTELDTLPEFGRRAIFAFELGKRGMLESSPDITVDPQGKRLENTTDYHEFMRRNTIIMDFSSESDGTYVQNMLSESVDRYGRIDVSHERIVYALRSPTGSETAAIAESMLHTSRGMKYMDSASRKRFTQSVADFQRAHGLSADGAMGSVTAKMMARETSVLDVKEMTSRIVLSEKPRMLIYAVPYDVIKRDPEAFSKGYESLEMVKKHALTQEQFQEIDQPGQRFTVFVFFLDRVDPAKAVRVCLASTENRWSDAISPLAYAPTDWPVLIESFQIDEQMGESQLYANVFMKGKYMYACVGCQRLK